MNINRYIQAISTKSIWAAVRRVETDAVTVNSTMPTPPPHPPHRQTVSRLIYRRQLTLLAVVVALVAVIFSACDTTDVGSENTIGFTDTEYVYTEGGGTLLLEVSLAIPHDMPLKIHYRLQCDGTATADDFDIPINDDESPCARGDVTLISGERSVLIPIPIKDDNLVEATENINVTLDKVEEDGVEGGDKPVPTIGNRKAVSVTIVDNDPIVIGFTETAYSYTEGAEIPLKLAISINSTLSGVLPQFSSTLECSGTADADDFTEQCDGAFITLDTSGNSLQITAPIKDDSLVEADETVTVGLSEVKRDDGGPVIIGSRTTTVTIVDNDNTKVGFRQSDVEHRKSVGNLELLLSSDKPADETISLNFSVDCSQLNPQVGYSFCLDGSIDFPPGKTEATIAISIPDDEKLEADEIFYVSLSEIRGGRGKAKFSETKDMAVKIIDDDIPTLVGFTVTEVRHSEADGEARLYLALDKAVDEPVTVDYSVECFEISPSDFETDPCGAGSIEFAAEETRVSITLLVKNDDIQENDEFLKVRVIEVRGGNGFVQVSSDDEVTLTIVDSDSEPQGSLDITVSPMAGGVVTATGIRCGNGNTDCSENVNQGTTITLTAIPASGYTFTSWGSACSGIRTTCRVTIDSDAKNVTTNFERETGTLNVAVSPTAGGIVTATGIGCGNGNTDCSETLNQGTTITLTATPASGYTFTSWGSACSGTNTTCRVTIDSDAKNVTASFERETGTLNVAVSPTVGGVVTSSPSGINCGGSNTDCSETADVGTPITLTANHASGYLFTGWSRACSGTGTCDVTIGSTRTNVTAVFEEEVRTVTLWTGVNGRGSVSPSCSSGCEHDEDSRVKMTASPDNGWRFVRWEYSGTEPGSFREDDSDDTITLTGDVTLTAVFEEEVRTVTLWTDVDGRGSVSPSCSSGCEHDEDSRVKMTASPDNGWRFVRWEYSGTEPGSFREDDSDDTITLTGDVTLTAVFEEEVRTVTLWTDVDGRGSVSPSCSSGCEHDEGSRVAITASPDSGWLFVRWEYSGTEPGSFREDDSDDTITLTGDVTLTAVFEEEVRTVTLWTDVDGRGSVSPSCSSGCEHDEGSRVAITASPDSGWLFVRWEYSGAEPGSFREDDSDDTVTLTGDVTLTAVFEEEVRTVTLWTDVDGRGSVSPSCSSGCEHDEGSRVAITASPDSGWRFVRWEYSGAEPGSFNSRDDDDTITLTGDVTLTAVFEEEVRTVTLWTDVDGRGSVSPSCSSGCDHDEDSRVRITASPDSGWRFVRWEYSGAEPGSFNSRDDDDTITLTGDVTLTAVFEGEPTSTTLANCGNSLGRSEIRSLRSYQGSLSGNFVFQINLNCNPNRNYEITLKKERRFINDPSWNILLNFQNVVRSTFSQDVCRLRGGGSGTYYLELGGSEIGSREEISC